MYASPTTSPACSVPLTQKSRPCFEIGGARTKEPSLWRPEPSAHLNTYVRRPSRKVHVGSPENTKVNVRENMAPPNETSYVSARRACHEPTPQQEPSNGEQRQLSALQWYKVARPTRDLVVGQWVVLENTTSCIAEAPNGVRALQRFPWNGPIDDLAGPYTPPDNVMHRWRSLDTGLLARVLDRKHDIPTPPGSRVTLHNLPLYLANLEGTDTYVLDYPITHTARVQRTVGGHCIRHDHGDLVHQLLAPCHDEDTLLLPVKNLRRCPVADEGEVKVYDRVETTHDIVPYRSGRIEEFFDDNNNSPMIRVRDARDGNMLHLRLRDTQKQFIAGDVVRVISGFYTGCLAVVKKGVTLDTQSGGDRIRSFAAFELRLTDNEENGHHKAGYKARQAPPTATMHQSVKETWLCSPHLVLKRLDVRVIEPHDERKRNNTLPSCVGKTGYIELESTVTLEQLKVRVPVHLDNGSRQVKIPAIQL
ncbi:hypothetical protein C8F01DRAFT_1091995 [Mycena amicta]|nr:hypothetical protein C8F01DRAFT_1091995 [Mycena amicta]